MPDMAQDRRQKRYQALCASIERLQRKIEKANRVFMRGSRQLVQLERQRRRLQKAMTQPESPKPEQQVEHPRVEAKEAAIADSLVEAVVQAEPKPKRQRKTLSETTDDIVTALITGDDDRARSLMADERTQRMEAMGFRKTKSRAKVSV